MNKNAKPVRAKLTGEPKQYPCGYCKFVGNSRYSLKEHGKVCRG